MTKEGWTRFHYYHTLGTIWNV